LKNHISRYFKPFLLTKSRSILFLLLLSGCIEQFEPKSIAYRSVLVVDGYLSDKVEPYKISLSRTRAIGDDSQSPESGATVSVFGGEGKVHQLTESDSGYYLSNPNDFVAQIGNKYVLDIITADGHHYQSDTVTMKPTPPIDSVYYIRERRIANNGLESDGIKIVVDSHDAEGKTRYYKYKWFETYQISIPYAALYRYDSFPPDPKFPLKYVDVFAANCYNARKGTSIQIASTDQLSEDRVSEFEVNYVTTQDYKLRTRYSILVEQLALDEPGYHFWSELQKNSENLGTLFDPLPYELRGNVKNVDEPGEHVVGYFDAAQSSEYRLFIEGIELRDLYFPSTGCEYEMDTVQLNDIPFYEMQGKGIAVLGAYPVEYVLMAPKRCTDCRVYGSLGKPDFW
jgi:hypothetical protein